MRICYLNSLPNVEELLLSSFKKMEWQPFSTDVTDFAVFDAVILVEPYECKTGDPLTPSGEYVSIFTIWKHYLERKAPNVKLLIAGFESLQDHPNYIPLLRVSEKYHLEEHIINSYPTQYDWEEDMKVLDGSVHKRLKTFFQGHSLHGILDNLIKLRRCLNTAELYYLGNAELKITKKPFEAIWYEILFPTREQARILHARWNSYYHYFKILPFYYLIHDNGIGQFIRELNNFLKKIARTNSEEKKQARLLSKEKTYQMLDAYQKIDDVIRVFDEVNRNYISKDKIATILFVDDDEDFHENIRKGWTAYHIKSAYTKQQALDLLQHTEVDLVLTDLNIESNDHDGFELISEIRKKGGPSVAVASTSKERTIIQYALHSGAMFYFHKPYYNIDTWLEVIGNLLNGKNYTEKEILEDLEKPTLARASILVIDDLEEDFNMVKNLSNEYDWQWALSDKEALDILKENAQFDLIILDLILDNKFPEKLIGLELLDKIREIHPKIPIVVVTQNRQFSTSLEVKRRGADYYLRKDHYDAAIWQQTIDLFLNTQ